MSSSVGLVRLRPTTAADLDFVLELEGHPDISPFIAHWTREQHQSAIDSAQQEHWVLVDSAGRVGYVILQDVGCERVRLRRVAIAKKGCGYGRFALRETKRIVFEDWGAEVLWLDVLDFNTRAESLYRSEGWVTVGSRPAAEACGVGEGTALLMELRR